MGCLRMVFKIFDDRWWLGAKFWKSKDKSQLGHKTENAIISTFRVYILVFTIIAILAVDFQIFPPHFGKTHGYGVSVMDIGVGRLLKSVSKILLLI